MFCNYLKEEFYISLKHAFLSFIFHVMNSNQRILNKESYLVNVAMGHQASHLKSTMVLSILPEMGVWHSLQADALALPRLFNTPFCTWNGLWG